MIRSRHRAVRASAGAAALTAALTVALAACTTDVPVGFGTGTSLASRDVVASPERLVDAARAVLYEFGDAVETELRDSESTLRTGRARIVIRPRGAGTSHLEVYVAQYVGPAHEREAERVLEAIVQRLN